LKLKSTQKETELFSLAEQQLKTKNLDSKVGHLAGQTLQVPDDELPVPRTAGDGLDRTRRARVHAQLVHLSQVNPTNE
jgi:hypothetical protein